MRLLSPISLCLSLVAVFGVNALLATPELRADEGMWLFTDPPADLLAAEYDFRPTGSWLEHIQRSSVRFNNGGSGSFVSADGLVMTNQHVGAGALQKLSTPDIDYVEQGFYAKTRDEELPCKDLELNVLVSIEDVTERIRKAVPADSAPEEAEKARRAVMNTIEKESFDATGLRSDVVTLYRGGLYHLYRYKRYTDVRLVFAPEHAAAFFGGDPDNFEYPRYVLDVCFFRIYEDGKPVRLEHYLEWSPAGAGDGDLVFVSGHPGRTDRLNTMAHLEFLRDRVLPERLDETRRREINLAIYSGKSAENARQAQREYFSYQNRRKALLGMLAGLQDPALMDRKREEEQALRDAVEASPELTEACGGAWDEVAAAIEAWRGIYRPYHLLERRAAFNSELFSYARTLLRLAVETEKPNADRLREYRESNLPSVRLQLFSTAPIYKELETAKLADSLGMLVEEAGAENGLVRKVLDGMSPSARAAELVRGTRLDDPEYRKELAQGGLAALTASEDAMIQLARLADLPARRVRSMYEQKVDEPLQQAYAKVAKARFAVGGTNVYPDATFTLRLAFGIVAGYTELGEPIPPWTSIGGAFRHASAHGDEPPFRLPESWTDAKADLDLDTPLNFVSTVDIIGGNSGSPVVDRDGQVVGLIFDGNRHSLAWDYVYSDEQGRAIAVHSEGIVDALKKVYGAGELAEELGR